MREKTRWTDSDFDEISWHDCMIRSITLDQDGEWQSDLVLDLDFILEWISDDSPMFRFRIAPAQLRFTDVGNLRFDIHLGFKEPMTVYSVTRTDLPPAGKGEGAREAHYVIDIEYIPRPHDNRIEFDATGFTQHLTGVPVETNEQYLTTAEREASQREWLRCNP